MQDGTNYSIESLALPPAEAEVDNLELDYEGFISAWSTVNNIDADVQWAKGDLMSKFCRTFSERDMEKLAVDLKVTNSTLRQYKWVSEKFPARDHRQLPGLSWTHFRTAAGTSDPLFWVQSASDNEWTDEQLKAKIREASEDGSIEGGRRCDNCGDPLPDEPWFLRRGKTLLAACRTECALRVLMPIYQSEKDAAEQAEQEETEQVEQKQAA